MTPENIRAQFPHTLKKTHFAELGTPYYGKVRDVYDRGDHLVMITTDRVSAFDRVLGTIPFKGEILNAMTQAGYDATQDIVPNAMISRPDPSVFVAKKCTAYPVEWVVRGYVTGSLWRDLKAGTAEDAYDLRFPANIRKDEALPSPLLTPSTKAADGDHDRPTSRRDIIASGAMTAEAFDQAGEIALALFERGQQVARARGLILVDTKYEMGLDTHGNLTLIDEVHTPDSSRYWVGNEYAARFARGDAQRMLDKENLRQWLAETHGFMGEGPPPGLSDEIRVTLSQQYMDVHQRLLGTTFTSNVGYIGDRIQKNLHTAGLL